MYCNILLYCNTCLDLENEHIMSLKLVIRVKAMHVETCKIPRNYTGYKRTSHFCSVIIGFLLLLRQSMLRYIAIYRYFYQAYCIVLQ